MQVLQLFIENERVDLYKDESVSITQSMKNVKDISKIFTEFTKTFTIPATKTNNRIFKHYYNFDIVNGYDARLKKNARLEINNLPFKKGKIKLEGVDLKNEKASNYRITFFGSTVELKDLVGDDQLSSLTFPQENLLYGPNTVKGRLTQPENTTRNVIAPLITHTQRLYYDSNDTTANTGNLKLQTNVDSGVYWNQLKYAIRVNKIIERIEAKYVTPNYPINLSFSTDFFKNVTKPEMDHLFLWLHRKSGDVENLGGTSEVESLVDSFSTFQDSDYDVVHNGTQLYVGVQQIVDIWLLQFYPSTADLTKEYSVRIANDLDATFYVETGITGNRSINFTQLTGFSQGLLYDRNYTVFVTTEGGMTFNNIRWRLRFDQQGEPELDEFISTSTFSVATTFQFNINQQMPDMKIIEFLTGLFKMFNLTAFLDESASDDTNKVIKVLPLDEFYQSFNTYEIDEYVDVNKKAVNVALPYKKIKFEYKDTKTFLANRFNQLANRSWGGENFTTGEAELDGKLYKVIAPFSHMQFERLTDANNGSIKNIQWGYSVNESQNAYKGAPLLFYPVRKNTGGINFVDSIDDDGNADGRVGITYVNMPSNSVQMSDSPTATDNINFIDETNEYSRSNNYPDSLFNVYYRNYIRDIFDTKKRIIKIKAFLPLKIFRKLTLSDRLVFRNQTYKINEIKTNLLTGESDIELLNIL